MTEQELCPWLARAYRGRFVVNGRASVPDGAVLPTRVEHRYRDRTVTGAIAWRRQGAIMAFEISFDEVDGGDGILEAIEATNETLWGVNHMPWRVDRVTWRARSELDDRFILPSGGWLSLRDGLVQVDDDPNAPAMAERDLVAIFGDRFRLGAWKRVRSYPNDPRMAASHELQASIELDLEASPKASHDASGPHLEVATILAPPAPLPIKLADRRAAMAELVREAMTRHGAERIDDGTEIVGKWGVATLAWDRDQFPSAQALLIEVCAHSSELEQSPDNAIPKAMACAAELREVTRVFSRFRPELEQYGRVEAGPNGEAIVHMAALHADDRWGMLEPDMLRLVVKDNQAVGGSVMLHQAKFDNYQLCIADVEQLRVLHRQLGRAVELFDALGAARTQAGLDTPPARAEAWRKARERAA